MKMADSLKMGVMMDDALRSTIPVPQAITPLHIQITELLGYADHDIFASVSAFLTERKAQTLGPHTKRCRHVS